VNRSDFQLLAETRVREAKALIDAGLFDGAYYLCGYAVECGLKACIANATQAGEFPDKTKVNKSYTHELDTLLGVAGLRTTLDTASASNPAIELNWKIAVDWNEEARYLRHTDAEARELYEAVTDPATGVLTWLKAHW
jgi:hypothetical protein